MYSDDFPNLTNRLFAGQARVLAFHIVKLVE